jgi:hypothetical protein
MDFAAANVAVGKVSNYAEKTVSAQSQPTTLSSVGVGLPVIKVVRCQH